MSGRTRRTAAALAAVLLLAGCGGGGAAPPPAGTSGTGPSSGADLSAWAGAVSAAAQRLPTTHGPYAGPLRVAEGLNPPTNSWISGAVFGDEPLPVFTGVLAFRPYADGFGAGLPLPHATAATLFGSYPEDLRLDLDTDAFELVRLDALSAELSFSAGGTEMGRLTAAEGWPYLAYRAVRGQTVRLSLPPAQDSASAQEGAAVVVGEKRYRTAGAGVDAAGEAVLEAGQTLFLYAEPAGASAQDLAALAAGAVPLAGTATAYAVDAGEARTTYRLDTGGADTVFAGRPHQDYQTGRRLGAGYASIYGELSLYAGNEFGFAVDSREPVAELDLGGLSPDERAALAVQVEADAAAVGFEAADTYYGGKALYRAVNVHLLAVQLGLDDLAAALKRRITDELDRWMDPAGCTGPAAERCFAYDPVLGGVVGLAPAYGSDEFNDHHFHYGYFLYAVGALARTDPDLADRYRAVADLLAADIASPEDTAAFPQRRAFDDWTGHSWASGTTPFADGNNQESSSEAVTAWAGLALWAEATDNPGLRTQAVWMLSTEIRTALDYWVYPETPEGFEAPLVSLNWGGKRDYATFFDPSPAAILGIQLIPFGPTMEYLRADPERIAVLVDGALPGDSLEQPLADYLLMFLALADPERALELARRLPDARVDNGNSRSYLIASILAARSA